MEYTDEFEKFWKLYPKRWNRNSGLYVKRKKPLAFKKWQRLPQGIRDKCLRVVKKIWKAEGGSESVRDCVTWLNQEGYDEIDEPEEQVQHLPESMTANILKIVPSEVNTNNRRNEEIKKLK